MCRLAGTWVLYSPALVGLARAQSASAPATLLSAPIQLGGEWGRSLPASALKVVTRMRDVSLSGVKLVSDRQPDSIRVDDHSSGPPSIWLHFDRTRIAWIIVDIGERDWCKLAYQFGHELGHVLCNSWGPDSKGPPPCRWLEESMVEAFSLRGLGRLATSWELNPPFPGNNAFGVAIRRYRQNAIDKYANAVDRTSYADLANWFRKSQGGDLEKSSGLGPIEGPAILAILAELEKDDTCVGDLGALNRWPARTGTPLENYLTLWTASCAEVGAPGRLPAQLRRLLLHGDGNR